MRSFVRLMLVGVLTLGVTLPVMAQQDPAPAKPKKGDPDEVVCERQEILGSRLGSKKICMTRAQWEDQKRSDRDLVSGSQLKRCNGTIGC